jgi:peptidyl-prolyl cis-trans isomerase D
MLNLFRSRGVSNVIYGAIIVATIFAFVVTFRPNATSRTASLSETCVARVRGRCIDPKAFASAYRMLLPSRSSEASRRLNIKRLARDGLVERELLNDEAKRLGLVVTDQEITDQLWNGFVRVSLPAADPTLAVQILQEMYQAYARAGLVSKEVAQAHFEERDPAIPVDFRDPKTKTFDMKVYERAVRNLSNRSPVEFRAEQERELLAARMRDVIRDPIRVSDREAWDEYDRRFSTATASWAPVKEAWAARWAVSASQADVDAWAAAHQSDVDTAWTERKGIDAPQALHVRHILVKLPYGATDDEKALALAKLSWAAARVKAGESFAEVAREVSDDPGSASMGGDLGTKMDNMVRPFKEAANALRPGEVTAGAVSTQFGYHLIAKDDPARAAEVEAAGKRTAVRGLYAKSRATEVAQTIAKQIGEAMRAGKSADDAIHDAIAPYVRPDRAPRLRVLPPPAGEATDAGAGDAGATARQAALPDRRFDASTDEDRPKAETSTAFNRGGDPFPGLSPEGTASVVAFAFSAKEGDVMGDPARTTDAFVAVQLKQHKAATREDFDKDRATFEQGMVAVKRDEALAMYVKRLRDQAKDDIKLDDSFVQEAKVDGGAGGGAEDEDEY